MSARGKRKREASAAEGGGDEEDQAALDDEEDAEVQRRLSERRSMQNDKMRCVRFFLRACPALHACGRNPQLWRTRLSQ